MGSDLIVVAGGAHGLPGPVHQLMQRLLLDRQILWVDADAFFPASPSIRHTDKRLAEVDTACGPVDGATMLSAKSPFPILTSSVVETDGIDRAGCDSPLVLTRRIRRAAAVLGLHRPMLWLASPWTRALAELFAGPALVYQHVPVARFAIEAERARPGDADVQAAAIRSAEEAARQEAAIALRADLILAPTVESAARFDQHKTRLLPNGVDTDLFETPAQRALDMPWDRPVAGFHGHIDARFDTDGVAELARQLPQWHFMLIGPVSADVSRLQAMDNVTLTGCLPHEELPRYSQYWTAAIMPLRAGAPMLDAPLQLGEYLAAGLPVVGFGAQNLGRYSDLVSRADSPAALAQALQACAEEPPSCRALRQARLLVDSWTIRAGFVNRLLDKLEARERLPGSAYDQVEAWKL